VGIQPSRESGVQRACREWPTLWGALAIRVNSGATKVGGRYVRFNSEAGCADLICCLPGGQFLSLEVKRPGARTEPGRAAEQSAHRERVRKSGGLALVVASLDELLRELREAGYDTTSMS
jgi:hypothetical protein